MANITLWGASYQNVSAVKLPMTGGGTFSFPDVTDTTAAAADVASGKYFYTSAGVRTQGTSSGGGSSQITKVCSEEVAASTTSTSASTLQTWNTNHTEIWTSDYVVLVHIHDKAGARKGYWYQSYSFFLNTYPAFSPHTTSTTTVVRFTDRVSSSGSHQLSTASGTTAYGVYADTLYSDGRIRLRTRYNATSSLTINGTYVVDVYLVDLGTLFPTAS